MLLKTRVAPAPAAPSCIPCRARAPRLHPRTLLQEFEDEEHSVVAADDIVEADNVGVVQLLERGHLTPACRLIAVLHGNDLDGHL